MCQAECLLLCIHFLLFLAQPNIGGCYHCLICQRGKQALDLKATCPGSFRQWLGAASSQKCSPAMATHTQGAMPARANALSLLTGLEQRRSRDCGAWEETSWPQPLSLSLYPGLASRPNPLAKHCSPHRQGQGGASHRQRAGQSHSETTSWAAQRK